jgi:phage shock protein PspC (stress-responsive transcriptional regulator)
MIGGVCAGVAEYFDWDPTLVRAAYAIMFFLGGVGLLLYLVLWIVMPMSSDQ